MKNKNSATVTKATDKMKEDIMTKALLGILVVASTVPFLAGHSEARDNGFDVRFIAQDKITFESDKRTTYIEATSTFDGFSFEEDMSAADK